MRAARAGAGAARRAFALAGARTGPSPARAYATWAVSAGNGDHGRLGHGPSGSGDDALGLSSARFQIVQLPVDAVAACAGGAHTVLVGADGAVYTCGLNDFGQLGHSPGASHAAVPKKVEGLPEHDPVVAAAAGHFHTLCLTRDGEVWAFGRNDRAQCGAGPGPGGYAASAAPTPPSLASLSPEAPGGDDRGPVTNIAAGARHSIAVTANGAVFTWGADFEGCLGHGGETSARFDSTKSSFLRAAYDSLARFAVNGHRNASSPRLVRALADAGVRAVAASCGDAHSLVLDASGTVHAFGQGRFNQLGVGAARNVAWLETPTIVEIPAELSGGGVARVEAGGNFNVAVTRDGGLLSWGANGNGECGGGAEDDGRRDRPRAVARPTDPKTRRSLAFQEVDAGWRHAAATTRDGRLFAWGWGGSAGQHWEDAFTTGGQLGVGDGQVDHWEPTRVPGIGGGGGGAPRAKSVSCGFNHTAALVSDDPIDR